VLKASVGISLAAFVLAGARLVAADARPVAAGPAFWVARNSASKVFGAGADSGYFTLLIGRGRGRMREEGLDAVEDFGGRVRVMHLLAEFTAVAYSVSK